MPSYIELTERIPSDITRKEMFWYSMSKPKPLFRLMARAMDSS
jgi:hypothetical protein